MDPYNNGGQQNGNAGHSSLATMPPSDRPWSFHEALPYSPHTAHVPLIPDIIPNPTLGLAAQTLPLSDFLPANEYDNLNQESFEHLSRNAKYTIDQVLQDLRGSQRTHIKFKSLPDRSISSQTNHSDASVRSLTQDLSPMAKAVYNKVGSYFKTTKTNTPSSPAVNGNGAKGSHSASPAIGPPSTPKTDDLRTQNAQSYRANSAKIEVAIPSKPFDRSMYLDVDGSSSSVQQPQITPVPLPHQPQAQFTPVPPNKADTLGFAPQLDATPSKSSFSIVLKPGKINREEFVEVESGPEPLNSLSERKKGRTDYADTQDVFGHGLDQRQRSNEAVNALSKLIKSIFDAVGSALAGDSGVDHMITLNTDQEAMITTGLHQKLHAAIQRVIGLSAFERIPVEHLMQLMKLSEGSLKQVEEFTLRIEEGWDEEAVESWVQQLADVDTALKGSRTCLRILSGGREDKQLYSETFIQRTLTLFRSVVEDIIIPIVEMRNSGPNGPNATLFRSLVKNKKAIGGIFVSTQKLAAMFAELVTKIEFSDLGMNTLEFLASRLVFVENAHYERDSILGIQKFDGLRLVAMDLLCQIFMMKPQQRQGIFDDILTSLEKLPSGRHGSRQFKLADGGSIQPVSALLMRLIQASAGKIDDSKDVGRAAMLRALEVDNQVNGAQDATKQATSSLRNEEQAAQNHGTAIQDLESVTVPLDSSAYSNAAYVITFIKTRAMQSTKTGDSPYRNLLDLFIDDFTTCLDSPDWPAAEMFLRLLVSMMQQTCQNAKAAAPAKNMALEIIGTMCAAISRLRSHVKKTAGALEGSYSDELSSHLGEVANCVLDHKVQLETIISWTGPYRTVLEHLQQRSNDDPYLAGAITFLTTAWASRTHTGYDAITTDDWARDAEFARIAYRLRHMIHDRKWLANEYTFKAVEPSQARLAYSILILSSPLCSAYASMMELLFKSMTSDQATVRSRSLKSVSLVLETDPSLLDGESRVIDSIRECMDDGSIQVRDSALGLLGSCITMRPSLEEKVYPDIITRISDAGVGVRKRAMKLARDIYLRNQDKIIRSAIANSLLRRVQETDESVRELARQMVEEIWFAPFYNVEDSAAYQTALSEHVSLVIRTVRTGSVHEIFDQILQIILKPQDKSNEGPFNVCKKLVAVMFRRTDNVEPEDSSEASGADVLRVLPIFAKADPKLFNFEQLRLLKPHLSSWGTKVEMENFLSVAIIYRRVLSELSLVHKEFLGDVRKQLLSAIGKTVNSALDDIVACVKIISDRLQNPTPLASTACSALMNLRKAQKVPKNEPRSRMNLKMIELYSLIASTIATHTDLDLHIGLFRSKLPDWKGDDVKRLIIDILVPLASPEEPHHVRRSAIEAIGLVCQAWPRNFVLAKVYTVFQQVFDENEQVLQDRILQSMKVFLFTEEKRSEAGVDKATKKSLTVMGGTNFDDVASATTQRFLKDITRIALATQDQYAVLAMEVLGSINRQGLVHPKETGISLITLETSANKYIAELAFKEHRSLHEKHETVLEREYVKAVQAAYEYQRDVVGDTRGFVIVDDKIQSKLHLLIEVLKISKMKNRQRFVEKLCGQVEFDLASLDASAVMPQAVDMARFILENLGGFEYQTIGEIYSGVNKLEKMVNNIGVGVAQAIEAEVFDVRMDVEEATANAGANGHIPHPQLVEGGVFPVMRSAQPTSSVSDERLRQLAAASIILSATWETRTYLRRLYGMGVNRHDAKAKEKAKDLNRTPTKVQGIPSEKFYDELSAHFTGLQSSQHMLRACKSFVETLNVDKDFKISEEEDDLEMEGPSTPSVAGDDDDDEEGEQRGRKRKGTMTPGGRAKRQRSNSQPRKRGRPRKNALPEPAFDDGDWV